MRYRGKAATLPPSPWAPFELLREVISVPEKETKHDVKKDVHKQEKHK